MITNDKAYCIYMAQQPVQDAEVLQEPLQEGPT